MGLISASPLTGVYLEQVAEAPQSGRVLIGERRNGEKGLSPRQKYAACSHNSLTIRVYLA